MSSITKKQIENFSNYMCDGTDFIYTHFNHIHPEKLVFSKHMHEYYELILFKDANANFVAEGTLIPLKKNDLLITPAGCYHYIELNKNANMYERYNVLIKNPSLNSILDGKPLAVINIESMPIIKNNFERMDIYIDEYLGKMADDSLLSLLRSVTNELLINVGATLSDDRPVQITNPLLCDILDYISKNVTTIKSIDDIARHFYISVNYIHKLFGRHMKIPPKKYLDMKRLFYARQMIQNGEKLSFVAMKCGYSDYATFYRNFVKFFKYKPSDANELSLN